MIDTRQLVNLRLPGGFVIKGIEFTPEPLLDPLEREATAQTRIVGREFHLLLRAGLSQEESSITLYHEILEAAAVASFQPPAAVAEMNEGAFEQAARAAHERWGPASADNLNRLLQFHGFTE